MLLSFPYQAERPRVVIANFVVFLDRVSLPTLSMLRVPLLVRMADTKRTTVLRMGCAKIVRHSGGGEMVSRSNRQRTQTKLSRLMRYVLCRNSRRNRKSKHRSSECMRVLEFVCMRVCPWANVRSNAILGLLAFQFWRSHKRTRSLSNFEIVYIYVYTPLVHYFASSVFICTHIHRYCMLQSLRAFFFEEMDRYLLSLFLGKWIQVFSFCYRPFCYSLKKSCSCKYITNELLVRCVRSQCSWVFLSVPCTRFSLIYKHESDDKTKHRQ